jgi:tetratricopeptide (TPR) repeat protein
MALTVIASSVWFRVGIRRAVLMEGEIATVAESASRSAPALRLPHVEYQSPAHRAVLRGFGVGGADILRARNVSWLTAVAAIAAIAAAGWALFGPMEGLAAAFLGLGSLRLLQAAQSAVPDAFQMFWHAATASLFGLALRSSAWPVWIALGASGIIAALSGFQAVPLLIAVAAVGGAIISQRTRRDGAELRPPVWQYVSAVPVAVAVCALWSVTWMLTSREANPPIAKPPLMNLRYFGFLHNYLFGHGVWGPRLLGILAVVGVVGSLKKRIIRVDDLRRVYVDKRSRRPMVFLLLWFVVGIPAINLLLFNARRPQDPAVLNTLFVPLSLATARGLVLCGEYALSSLRRIAGLKLSLFPAVVVLGLLVGWFGQSTARKAYAGYRTNPNVEDAWALAAEYLSPRGVLAQAAMVTPPWATRLIQAHLGQALSGVEIITPTLGGQVDSLVRASPACWAILYQSDLYAHVPERVRASLDRNFEELKRFPTPWGGSVVCLATPWLRASESQWSVEQERLASGGDEADHARVIMARLYLEAGRSDSAQAALQQVLGRSPTSLPALMGMAMIAEREGDADGAVSWYARAARADSSDPRPLYEQGRLIAAAGRLPAAVSCLEKALVLENRHVQAAQLLARLYRDLGRTGEADALDGRIQTMGGKAIFDYEFGRVVAVRSAEFSTQTWKPGDEVALVVSWATVARSRTGVRPVLLAQSENSVPMLRPPSGGWSFSLPDSGFDAGITGADSLALNFLYREAPRRYPDDVVISLSFADEAGNALPVLTGGGEHLAAAPIARLVAWRTAGVRRVTVEAENMDQHPGFPVPGGINVGDAGLVHSFRFPGGPVTFEITARGTPAAGQWPRLIVEIGGEVVRELDVPDREWRTYSAAASPDPGLRAVRFRFPNDYVNPSKGEDRNLVIDRVAMVEEELQFRFETP